MIATIPTWTIKNHIKGNTFNAREITFPFDITNCRIDMQFRKQANDTIVFAWSTEDNTFDKISTTKIVMNQRILDVQPAVYISDLQVIFQNENVITYFKVRLEVEQDITIVAV